MRKYDGNIDAAADELQSVLDNVRPALRGSPQRSLESPVFALRVLEGMVAECEIQGIEYLKVSQLREVINTVKDKL